MNVNAFVKQNMRLKKKNGKIVNYKRKSVNKMQMEILFLKKMMQI